MAGVRNGQWHFWGVVVGGWLPRVLQHQWTNIGIRRGEVFTREDERYTQIVKFREMEEFGRITKNDTAMFRGGSCIVQC